MLPRVNTDFEMSVEEHARVSVRDHLHARRHLARGVDAAGPRPQPAPESSEELDEIVELLVRVYKEIARALSDGDLMTVKVSGIPRRRFRSPTGGTGLNRASSSVGSCGTSG